MAIIGHFTPGKDGGWEGAIRTFSINAKVRVSPNDNRDGERAPAFKVFLGQSQLGEAWTARSRSPSQVEYLRVRLDDPCFAAPIFAALFVSPAGDRAQLVWSRHQAG